MTITFSSKISKQIIDFDKQTFDNVVITIKNYIEQHDTFKDCRVKISYDFSKAYSFIRVINENSEDLCKFTYIKVYDIENKKVITESALTISRDFMHKHHINVIINNQRQYNLSYLLSVLCLTDDKVIILPDKSINSEGLELEVKNSGKKITLYRKIVEDIKQ